MSGIQRHRWYKRLIATISFLCNFEHFPALPRIETLFTDRRLCLGNRLRTRNTSTGTNFILETARWRRRSSRLIRDLISSNFRVLAATHCPRCATCTCRSSAFTRRRCLAQNAVFLDINQNATRNDSGTFCNAIPFAPLGSFTTSDVTNGAVRNIAWRNDF